MMALHLRALLFIATNVRRVPCVYSDISCPPLVTHSEVSVVPGCNACIGTLQAALAQAQLTFRSTSSRQPAGWSYTAPDDQALTWFAAEEQQSPNTSLSPEDYLTSPGALPLHKSFRAHKSSVSNIH